MEPTLTILGGGGKGYLQTYPRSLSLEPLVGLLIFFSSCVPFTKQYFSIFSHFGNRLYWKKFGSKLTK